MNLSKLTKNTGLVALALLPLAVLGFRFSLFEFKVSAVLLLLAFALSVVTLLTAIILLFKNRKDRSSPAFNESLMGLTFSSLCTAILLKAASGGAGVPVIHDISTDLENRPTFELAVELRGSDSNPLQRSDEEMANIADLQRQAYPDVVTLQTQDSLKDALAKSRNALEAMGLEIINESSQADSGFIEAVATTGLFGFKDDIVIRVTSTAQGAAIDARSVSRIGRSDLGANAKRIRDFFAAYNQ